MIGYDFDGVICSDVSLPWNDPTFDINILHDFRDKLQPIFYPTGSFCIITGRPLSEKKKTEEWCSKYNIHPQKIYYNPGSITEIKNIALHKANTLNKLSKITIYVESDPKQVEIIQQLTNKIVLHFSSFISKSCKEANIYI
jgi:hypothetical protein